MSNAILVQRLVSLDLNIQKFPFLWFWFMWFSHIICFCILPVPIFFPLSSKHDLSCIAPEHNVLGTTSLAILNIKTNMKFTCVRF
jgi:hypothetical protein